MNFPLITILILGPAIFYNGIRAECLDNSKCPEYLACVNQTCVDSCQDVCGENAICRIVTHIPICSCPASSIGDPFINCRKFNPADPCNPSPCDENTQCDVVDNIPSCKCLPGFYYNDFPLSGCHHGCKSDAECGPRYACVDSRCQDPCWQCGKNAYCDSVQNKIPDCKCSPNFYGDPLISCQPECTTHDDCLPEKPACIYSGCKNPCEGVCGTNANCNVSNGTIPLCSCPKDMTGNPFVSCS